MNYYLQNAKKRNVLTRFLTVEEQKLITLSGINYQLSNIGYERHRAYLYHGDIEDINFEINVLKLDYQDKYLTLTHAKILGALMALGITRDCIGDIIISEAIYIIVISQMSNFIITNLLMVDKAKVHLTLVENDIIKDLPIDIYEEKNIIVASLRLDVLVSGVTNFSREQAKEYIALKNVKVNGQINTNIDYMLKVNDLISIHRFGRTILKEIVKKTKKEKYVLLIQKTK